MLLASGVVLQSKATWLSSSLRPRLQSLRMPCEKSWWHGISWKIASSMKCYILATSYKLQQIHFALNHPDLNSIVTTSAIINFGFTAIWVASSTIIIVWFFWTDSWKS
jgi:hypothetical protein